jgi:hypothetical protein
MVLRCLALPLLGEPLEQRAFLPLGEPFGWLHSTSRKKKAAFCDLKLQLCTVKLRVNFGVSARTPARSISRCHRYNAFQALRVHTQ